jgi:hypothetical protein
MTAIRLTFDKLREPREEADWSHDPPRLALARTGRGHRPALDRREPLMTGPGLALTRRLLAAGRAALLALEGLPLLIGRIALLVTAVEDLVRRADRLVAATEQVRAEAAEVVGRVELTRAQAAGVVERAGALEADVARLVQTARPLLAALAEVDPELVRTAARISPRLLSDLDALVQPLLVELRAAVPDVRAILPVVERLVPVLVDVETRIAGLPGASRLRKRGEREIESVDQSEQPDEPRRTVGA